MRTLLRRLSTTTKPTQHLTHATTNPRHFTTHTPTMSLFRPFLLDDLRPFFGAQPPSLFNTGPFGLLSDTGRDLLTAGPTSDSNELTTTSPSSSGALAPWFGQAGTTLAGFFNPKLDLHETEEEFALSMELPGVKKENVKINVDDRVRKITISGTVRSEWDSTKDVEAQEAKDDTKAKDKKNGEPTESKKSLNGRPILSERLYGSFSRSLILPETVQLDAIAAKFNDGVLQVTIPKKHEEHAKPRAVTIEDAKEE